MGANYVIKRLEAKPSFLKRHSRWLAFLSTIVVLGTFIVNEGLVDEAKDLSNSLDTARNAFAQRSREETILKILNRVEESVDSARTGIYSSHAWGADRPDFDRLNSEFGPLLELYDKLPYDRNLDDLHWKLKYLLKTAKSFEVEEDAEVEIDPRHLRSQELENGKETSIDTQLSALAKMLRLGTENYSFEVLAKVNLLITERAQSAQEVAEKRKKIGKHLGFILYPLGVFLGLLGKLNGEGESDIEEAA
jgi:hypothetical protein